MEENEKIQLINSQSDQINLTTDEVLANTPDPSYSNSLYLCRPSYTPTPKLSERKRALFPNFCYSEQSHCSNNSEDIGHMSPLQYSSETSSCSTDPLPQKNSLEQCKSNDCISFVANESVVKHSFVVLSPVSINNKDNEAKDSDLINICTPMHIPESNNTQSIENKENQCDNFEQIINVSGINSCLSPVKLNFKEALTNLKSINFSHEKKSLYDINEFINKSNIYFDENDSDYTTCSNNSIPQNVDTSKNLSENYNIIIPETPVKNCSPRTPYETLNSELDLPRLNNRKSLLGIFNSIASSDQNKSLNEKYIDIFNKNAKDDEKNIADNTPPSVIEYEHLNFESEPTLKRKLSMTLLPVSPVRYFTDSKLSKLEHESIKLKNSKARMSLFSSNANKNIENVSDFSVNEKNENRKSLSPKSFYSISSQPVNKTDLEIKNDNFMNNYNKSHNNFNNSLFNEKQNTFGSIIQFTKTNQKSNRSSVFLCGRRNKTKSNGAINAGVRTGITKSKFKFKKQHSKLSHNFSTPKLEKLKQILYSKNSNPNSCPDKSSPFENHNPASESTKNSVDISLDQLSEMDNLIKEIKKPVELCSIFKPPVQNEHNVNSKRPLSPENSEILDSENKDSVERPRKFFKSKQSRNNSVHLNKNLKLRMKHGKICVEPVKCKTVPQKKKINESDFTHSDDTNLNKVEFAIGKKVSTIIETLEKTDDVIDPKVNNGSLTLLADYIIKNDNSILLHQNPDIEMLAHEDVMMSPTSLMCNMTSGLAINSPKQQSTITKNQNLEHKLISCVNDKAGSNDNSGLVESDENSNQDSDNLKLFPVFNKGFISTLSEEKRVKKNARNWKALGENQYQLDAGQKRWGQIQCPQCELVYQQGEPDDEREHYEYHNFIHNLRFLGWKHERIVTHISNTIKIIEVTSGDSKAWWKKVRDILEVVDKDLGFDKKGVIDVENTKVYLYIEKKRVIGFVSAVYLTKANKMIPSKTSNCCTEEYFPAKCGISRLWVLSNYRGNGVGTILVDIVRKHFILNKFLSIKEIAFSIPSEMGHKFAQKYTQSDNYLIFTDV